MRGIVQYKASEWDSAIHEKVSGMTLNKAEDDEGNALAEGRARADGKCVERCNTNGKWDGVMSGMVQYMESGWKVDGKWMVQYMESE